MSATFWFFGMPNHPIKTTANKILHQTTVWPGVAPLKFRIHPTWCESLNDSCLTNQHETGEMVKFREPLFTSCGKKKTNQLVLSSPNHQTSLALEKTRKMKPLSSKERWHGGARCFRIPHSGRRWNSTNPKKKQYSPLQATNSYHRGEILMKFDPLWFFIIIIHSCMVYFSMFWQGGPQIQL